MKDILGYYKLKNIGAEAWSANTIFISSKSFLLNKLLTDPNMVRIIDNNIKDELKHTNLYSSVYFVDYYMGIDPVDDINDSNTNNNYFMSIDLANDIK